MLRTLKNTYHLAQAHIALSVHKHPAKDMVVIGVTGTDGKTTTASLIFHILETAGVKAALISTLGAQIGKKTYNTGFHTTTPSSFALQKYVRRAKEEGCKYLVLEVTSHALDQNRVFGIPFSIGVITNITHEHLDYHSTYENYVRTKTKLLENSKVCILNMDDDSFKSIMNIFRSENKSLLTYSLDNKSADITPEIFNISSRLDGDFNKMNSLAAIAVGKALGLDDSIINKGIANFKPPVGRQETVFDKNFRVIIDFAHTPNSFQQVLPGIKKNTKGRLIHIFGAAGKRDVTKRKLMGEAASRFSDVIILTSEDSRGEDINKINEDIAQGFDKKFDLKNYESPDGEKFIYFVIPDRKEAIEFGLTIAKKGDTVVLTGKGHELSMNLGHGEIPWSEHEAVKEALKKLVLL